MLTASFMDYALLKAADMPEIVVRLIETGDAEGPFGAKGLGESGVIPVSAAVANAVKDAIGVRFTELPITPAPSCTRALAARERAVVKLFEGVRVLDLSAACWPGPTARCCWPTWAPR